MSTDEQSSKPTNDHHGIIRRSLRLKVIARIILSLATLFLFAYLGRQIVYLYVPLADATNVGPAFLSPFDAFGTRPLEVQFGENPISITRLNFEGDRQAATAQLENLCIKIASKSVIPSQPASQSEIDLIHSMGLENTSNSNDPDVAVHRIKSNNLTVVGIKKQLVPQKIQGQPDAFQGRVVAWGFASEEEPNSWNIRVVRKNPAPEAGDKKSNAIDLPPGSQKIIHMRSEDGNLVLAFKNNQSIATQIIFFDHSLSRKGWTKDHDWHGSEKGQKARYRCTANGQLQTADIHLQKSRNIDNEPLSTAAGLISVTSLDSAKN